MDNELAQEFEHLNRTIEELERRVQSLENPQVNIQVLKAKPTSKIPVRATTGSSGYDLYSTERVVVHARSSILVPTGLKVKIPEGYELQVRPKSGIALKYRLTVLNTPGTIDSDYRGEIGVIIVNHSEIDHVFEKYDKIAQIVCCRISPINFVEVTEDEYNKEDSVNERGTGGFGSTGK